MTPEQRDQLERDFRDAVKGADDTDSFVAVAVDIAERHAISRLRDATRPVMVPVIGEAR